MKYIYIYIIILFSFSCSNFSESLKENFLSSKEITVIDFSTEFPVINITADQKEFDEMYSNFEEDIEIEGFLNLYRENTLVISKELIELEIKGAASAKFSLKSLGIKFDDTFDNENRELLNPKKILPHHFLDKVKAFRLRNSGNDFGGTMLKDISYTQLAINSGLDLDLTYYEPALVFINDAFLGVMNLRSEANTNGISRLNDTKKSKITLAKINYPGEVEKKDGDFDRIDNFINAIVEENFAYLKAEVDINNFIDYVIFQSYIANIDWPHNNVRFYAVEDAPFRFTIYDLDLANFKDIKNHPLDFLTKENPITNLFKVLYSDTDFKTQFENRYLEVIESSVLSSEKFNDIVDDNFNTIHSYMPYQIDKYTEIGTMIEWYRNINLLKENFRERERKIESLKPLF